MDFKPIALLLAGLIFGFVGFMQGDLILCITGLLLGNCYMAVLIVKELIIWRNLK